MSMGLASVALLAVVLGAEPKVGEAAPAFELVGSDGKTYTLEQFKGKQAVVIAWFPRAFTGGCTKECKSMKESGKELKELNIAYFTASTDPVEKNTDFAKSLELDYPILSDPKGDVARAYGVMLEGKNAAARWTFFIDKDGVLKAVDKEVKTATHGADIAKKAKELGIAG